MLCDDEKYVTAGHALLFRKLCKSFLHLSHHVSVFCQLALFFFDLGCRCFADEFFVAKHTVYTGKFFGQALLFFLQSFDLFLDIYQLCKGHVDCRFVDHCRNRILADACLVHLYVDIAGITQSCEEDFFVLEDLSDCLTKELARSNGMLNNERFISKAPQAKIDEEKAKLTKYTEMMAQVKERLAQLVK